MVRLRLGRRSPWRAAALATREEAPTEVEKSLHDAAALEVRMAMQDEMMASDADGGRVLKRIERANQAADRILALRAQPPAREDAQPVAWRWRVEGDRPWFVTYRKPENALLQIEPLYAHPASDALRDEVERLRAALNTPEVEDFAKAVVLEAQHQRERWPSEHDAGKAPLDWFWLVGYLAQKAAAAQMSGDDYKAKHHTISTAAALANWHAAIAGDHTGMRPGIEPPETEALAALQAEQGAK